MDRPEPEILSRADFEVLFDGAQATALILWRPRSPREWDDTPSGDGWKTAGGLRTADASHDPERALALVSHYLETGDIPNAAYF